MKVKFKSRFANLQINLREGFIMFQNGEYITEDEDVIKQLIFGNGYQMDYTTPDNIIFTDRQGNLIDIKNPDNRAKITYPPGLTEKVSIIVGTRFNPDNLENCLASLVKNTPKGYQLILVDNQSSEKSKKIIAKYAKKLGKAIKTLKTDRVLGFSEFNNMAVKYAAKPYVLYLNDDTILSDKWLESMMDIMLYTPNVGAVGKMALRKNLEPHQLGTETGTSKSPVAFGYCMLLRREDAWLDEDFKDYGWEDIDLSERIKHKGYDIWVERLFPIIHLGGSSINRVKDIDKIYQRNQSLYEERWKKKR